MRILFIITLISLNVSSQTFNCDEYFFSNKFVRSKDNYNAALENSYIGQYESMLRLWDIDEKTTPKITKDDSVYLAKFKPVDALEYIEKKASSEKIIIINEAHHQPYHRVFTKKLLKSLYEKGFRYFGAETLSSWDTLLNKRKYVIQNTGYYTREPLYADLIRTALDLGYTVFAYETNSIKSDSSGINFREIEQAKNIKKVMDSNPNGKILIHCGYDHLVETDYPGWGKAMAGRLIEITGVNPFTIDQVKFTERSSSDYENPFFKAVDINYFAFFIDSLGNLFKGSKNYNPGYDVRLYHPRTKWENGRPNWMFDNNRKPYYINDSIKITFPCLIFAYLENEISSVQKKSESPIPYDIIELENKLEKKALSLKPGKYKIVIRDKKNKFQYININI